MSVTPMSCREFVGFLMEYLEGRLNDAEREVFERHLGDCPSCICYLDTYRETVRLGRDICAADGSIPDDVPEALVQAILATRREGGSA